MPEKHENIEIGASDGQTDITVVFAVLWNLRVPLHRPWELQGAEASQAHGEEEEDMGA